MSLKHFPLYPFPMLLEELNRWRYRLRLGVVRGAWCVVRHDFPTAASPARFSVTQMIRPSSAGPFPHGAFLTFDVSFETCQQRNFSYDC